MQPLSIDLLLRNLMASMMMPPLLWIFLAVLVLVFIRKQLRLQRALLFIILLMMWMTSTTAFANWFVAFSGHWMDWPVAIQLSALKNIQHPTQHESKIKPLHQLQVEKLLPASISDKKTLSKETQTHETETYETQTTEGHMKEKQIPDIQSKTIQPKGSPTVIVVLGGGKQKGVMDRQDLMMEDLSKEALQRVRYAAMLSRYTQLPILVTGGALEPSSKYPTPEAQVMAKVLQADFNVKVRWIEDQSKTTQENAQFSATILQKEGIDHIYLVSHFWHLPRAKRIFEKYGFEVTPAPMGFEFDNTFDLSELTILDFLPNASALQRVREIWHEVIGGFWYQFRYKS